MSVFKIRRIFPILSVTVFFGVLSSYTISIMSGVLLFLEKNFQMDLLLKQQLVSISILGALCGVISAIPLSNRIGRKKAIAIAAIFYVVSSLLSTYSVCVYELLLARFLAGIGVGITSVAIPLYLAEISPPKNRGAIVTGYQLAVTLGILVAYFTNWSLATSQNWQAAFFIPFVITCLGGFSLFFIPESFEESTPVHIDRKGLRSRVWIAIFLAFFQQVTGINTIIYYGPIIFRMVGFGSLSAELLATLGIGIVNVIATIFALLWIDKIGRKKLLIVGLIGMGSSLLCLSIFFHIGLAALLSAMSFVVFFAIGLGPAVWVVVSEIFPRKWRASGISIALFVSWLSNYLISSSFLALVEYLGKRGVFAFFASTSMLALFFVFFFLPETKGKALE